MNTPRPIRARLLTASLAVLTSFGVISTYSGGVSETEAAWSDRELANASVTANWVNGGWSKVTANSMTNYNSYVDRPEESYTEIQSNQSTSPTNGTTSTKQNFGDKTNNANFKIRTTGARTQTNIVACTQAAAPRTTQSPSADCISPPAPAQTLASATGTAGSMSNPSSSNNARILWTEAQKVKVSAECAPDGTSRALNPSVYNSKWGNSIGVITSTGLFATPSDESFTLVTPQLNKSVSGWIKPKYAFGVSLGEGNSYAHYTVVTRSFTAPGYALSDLYIQWAQYSPTGGKYLGSHELVIARAECGVTSPRTPRVPLATTFSPRTYPPYPSTETPSTAPVVENAPLPDPTTGLISQPAGRMALLRAAPGEDPVSSSTPPATTTTSPLATTTAEQTTTSAPPEPGTDGPVPSGDPAESTAPTVTVTDTPDDTAGTEPTDATSTERAPDPAPTEPAPLAPGEPTVICGNISVDGAFQDVVARGDQCPTSPAADVLALDAWIVDGTEPGPGRSAFTSDDPAADGWRWALIDEQTGTVLYVR